MLQLRRIAFITALVAAGACGKKNDSTAGSGSASASDNGSASAASGSGSASASAVASGSGSASASDQPQVNTPRGSDSGSGSASASGSGSASAAAAIDTTNMAHKAGNCPSTVAGSTTTDAPSKDGKALVLTITSKDASSVWAIQTRAHHLVDVQNAPDKKVEHTGKGTGGGGGGLCPVVTKDTKVAVANQNDGATVTLTPTGKLTVAALQTDVEDRIKKSSALTDQIVKADTAAGGQKEGGTGGGGGHHGGNRTGKGDGSGPRDKGAGSGSASSGQRSSADPNPAAKAGAGHF